MRAGIGFVVAVTALCALPRAAFAQEICDPDGGSFPPNYGELAANFPGDMAVNVPIDGFIRLRYVGHAPSRAFVILRDLVRHSPVMGTVNAVDDEVHFQSAAPLSPNTQYSVQVSDITGGASGNTFTFTTGQIHSIDSAPQFAGAQDISFEKSGASDLCSDPNAARITLLWHRATSNGWPDSEMEYVVYETRGPGISGPVERARERLQPGASSTCASSFEFCPAVRLSSANASGPVCFNVQAIDPYGRPDGNTQEQCVDPSRGNFFNGCSVSRDTTHSRRVPIEWLALGVSAAWLANRRRLARKR